MKIDSCPAMLLVLRCWRSVTHVTETGKLSTDKDVFPFGYESWFIFSPVLDTLLASIASIEPTTISKSPTMTQYDFRWVKSIIVTISEIRRILISQYAVTRWHARERPPYCGPRVKSGLIAMNPSHQMAKFTYCEITSSNTSRLEAHAGFFRLLMKRIFGPYTVWPFNKKLIFWLVTCIRTRNYTVIRVSSNTLFFPVDYLGFHIQHIK